jgi:hypothetical protein
VIPEVLVGAGEIISASAIVAGFGVTAIMFRIQRELYVYEVLKKKPLWLAWADYLVLTSVALAVFGGTVPLLAVPTIPRSIIGVAAAACVAALVLLAGYVPSILAHYRIELGARREGPHAKGEPLERWFVIGSLICATAAFILTLALRLARE